jgi:hypothetical protein
MVSHELPPKVKSTRELQNKKMTIKQKQNFNGGCFADKNGRKGQKKSWWPIVNAVIYIFIFMGGIYYIAGINDLSIKGFKLQDLKNRSVVIKKENEDLELQIMRLESYENLTARAAEISMVRVDRIDYVSAANDEVAKR